MISDAYKMGKVVLAVPFDFLPTFPLSSSPLSFLFSLALFFRRCFVTVAAEVVHGGYDGYVIVNTVLTSACRSR